MAELFSAWNNNVTRNYQIILRENDRRPVFASQYTVIATTKEGESAARMDAEALDALGRRMISDARYLRSVQKEKQ